MLQLRPRFGIDRPTARYDQWPLRALQPLDDSPDELRFRKRASHMPNPLPEKLNRPVKIRKASGKLANNCSGREIRSKNLETGLNASLALTSRSIGCSTC